MFELDENKENWEDSVLYLGPYLIKADEYVEDGYRVKEGTTTIAKYAFKSCELLTTIVLPDSLKYINEYAFTYCYYLETVIIPEGTEQIGKCAFELCERLDTIFIPESVTLINSSAFSLCPSYLAIIGYKNSYAHEYASKKKINFYALDEAIPYPPNEGYRVGDPDYSGKINVRDATLIQKHIAGLVKFHEFTLILADVDENSDVNIKDATAIQKYIAGI